jgi:hypothetical protein
MSAGPPPKGAAAPLEWTFNPWRQDHRIAVVGAIVAGAVAILIAGFELPPLAVFGLTLAFLASIHSAILPTRCRVDEEGVARRLAFVWERRPWGAIRRACLERHGLYVSTLSHRSALTPFRSLWLPVPRTGAPTLLEELRRRLADHGLPS